MPFKYATAVCGWEKKKHNNKEKKTEVSTIQRKSQPDVILAGAAQRLEEPCNPLGGGSPGRDGAKHDGSGPTA